MAQAVIYCRLFVGGPTSLENGLMERDSKRIVREWNREIEAELRRFAARQDSGPWKFVVWALLEVTWLVVLVVVLGLFTSVHW